MGLFNSSCCPSKPKRTMDYILNWIDTNSLIIAKNTSYINDLVEWRRSVENDLYDHVKDVADEYIADYDWSGVPQFDVLSRSIATKADKTIPVAADSIALLDVDGNLKDSGANVSSFAPASHAHSSIVDTYSYTDNGISVDNGGINISVDNGESGGEVDITADNIGNLYRALATPSSVPENDDTKLITSKAVYVALQGKAGSVHTHNGIEDVDEGIQYAKVYADNQTQGGPNVIIELNDSNTPGSSVTKHATISIDNIDNLNRALEDPVKASSPQSAYSDDKLITAAAVMKQCSSRLDKPDATLMAKFNVSGGTLTILDDTTEYDEIFDLVAPGAPMWYSMFVGIYNSDDDVFTPFFGVASISGQYSNIDSTLEKISVTIYVGGYTIHLEKNVLTDVISVSMDSFAALLQNH